MGNIQNNYFPKHVPANAKHFDNIEWQEARDFSCEAELSTDDLHVRLCPVAGVGTH